MRNRSCRIRRIRSPRELLPFRSAIVGCRLVAWYRVVSKIFAKMPLALPLLVTKERARLSMGLTVIKRDGREEPVAFDKITARINKLAYGLNQDHCDPVRPSVLWI